MKRHLAYMVVGFGFVFGNPTSTIAQTRDIDCEIILCMAGGFAPPECKRAFRQMIKNVTPFPIKPPFGICTFVGGRGGTTPADLTSPEFTFLGKTRVLWYSETVKSSIAADGSLNDKPRWNLKSCQTDNTTCTTLARLNSSGVSGAWTSENGVAIPKIGGSPMRAVNIEFVDHTGKQSFTGWTTY